MVLVAESLLLPPFLKSDMHKMCLLVSLIWEKWILGRLKLESKNNFSGNHNVYIVGIGDQS